MRTTLASIAVLLLIGGCSSGSADNPAGNALKNPMDYDPMSQQNMDVGGGGTFDLDKAALRKDVDHVLNP
jgi:hypothetical protein